MKPLNIPVILDAIRQDGDYSEPAQIEDTCLGLHFLLATRDKEDIAQAMFDILCDFAVRGVDLGLELAKISPPPGLGLKQLLNEAHLAVALAYGAESNGTEGDNPYFFLALAFRHLLTICELEGIEAVDHINELLGLDG